MFHAGALRKYQTGALRTVPRLISLPTVPCRGCFIASGSEGSPHGPPWYVEGVTDGPSKFAI